MIATLAAASRQVLDFRIRNWPGSVVLGIAVFAVWIGPDQLFPGYHNYRLFSNSITGSVAAAIPETSRRDVAVLSLRALRASLFVPIAEELFWRGWLMRWIISHDFKKIPLGTWSPSAFWIVAALFASEHGPLWDVGLAAGVLYNWWMLRTKRIGDLVLAHGVTNACLSAYVVFAGHWEYWG